MQDRKEIKWAPFNSVINGKYIINELNKKRNRAIKPVLSEDQIEVLNEFISESYTNHTKINLYVYKNYTINKLIGYINNINIQNKYLIFNKTLIYFNQIIKITSFFDKSN